MCPQRHNILSKFYKTVTGILLIPVAIGVAKSFYTVISEIGVNSGTFHLLERGVLFYLIFHVFIARPVYLYVLGHEFVHVLATWLSGGHIVSFNVMPGGGSVVTSKTNFFIELSPYFIPIYTLLIGPAFLVLKAIGLQIPFMSSIFIFLIGVTLAFHFVMTTEALRLKQSDIGKSGIIFSILLIFICNLIIVMAVFCPIFSELSFVSFIKDSWTNSFNAYSGIYGRILEIINGTNTLQ